MDDQILVIIDLPAAAKNFEVWIPQNVRMELVQNELAEMLAGLSNGMFLRTDPVVLIDKSNGTILNINATAAELDLQQGAQLLLI